LEGKAAVAAGRQTVLALELIGDRTARNAWLKPHALERLAVSF